LPTGIDDRAADCWEPLFAIADAAGGVWPKLARSAAQHLVQAAAEETTTTGTELLEHIQEAFAGTDKLSTVALLKKLHDRDESPWNDIRGKPLDGRGLSQRLKGFGIKSHTVRVGDITAKGFEKSDFADSFSRYIGHKSHIGHIIDNKNNIVTDVT